MRKFINKFSNTKISAKLLFIITGIASTIWFLVRVIPKPQRAYYPCMRAAAPIMSSFVIYIISLSGSVLAFRKAKKKLFEAKYLAACAFIVISISLATVYFIKSSKVAHAKEIALGPVDGPNEPIGTAQGIMPGRVVWVWDTHATKGNPDDETINTYHFLSKYNNQDIYDSMMYKSILKLTEADSINEGWDMLFKYHNQKKGHGDSAYTQGEKILIKINQVSAGYTTDVSSGFSSSPTNPWDAWKIDAIAATQTTPYIVLSILRQLVNECGVAQSDIYIGDPISHIFSHNYDAWYDEFPDIHYIDRTTTQYGRTMIFESTNALVYYSDQGSVMTDAGEDHLFDIFEEADYLINVANLKAHMRAGISGNAKNHFGSHSRDGAWHLHPSLVAPDEGDGTDGPIPENITNSGYNKYRVLVDIMGNKYLGGNTMLYVIDGIYGGGYHDNQKPAKWKSEPFNNNWCNSIFLSQDAVAIESVCYDFLRTEFNGVYQQNHISPNWQGVDDYIHQAADEINWPVGITYSPNGDGVEIGSLGVHEHWNNPISKQYIKNLYPDSTLGTGIELVSIPDTLIGKLVTVDSNILPGNGEVIISPNPVRESSSIAFMLNSDEFVSISLYDINGRLVKPLVDKQYAMSGKFEYIFIPRNENIKTGYYVCYIQAGEKEYKGKIIVFN